MSEELQRRLTIAFAAGDIDEMRRVNNLIRAEHGLAPIEHDASFRPECSCGGESAACPFVTLHPKPRVAS